MKRIIYVSALLAGGVVSAFASGAKERYSASVDRCVAVNGSQIAALFDRWNRSLQTGDARKVAANYTHDSILLPTLSSRMRLTDKERINYFKGFLKKGPVGRVTSRKIRLGCNDATDTGNYTFVYKDGSRTSARYTFAYAWNGKTWLITSHHSSVTPDEK